MLLAMYHGNESVTYVRNMCNTCSCDFPDTGMFTLSLRRATLKLASTYKVNHSCLCYIYVTGSEKICHVCTR